MKISVISFSRAGAKKNLELTRLLQEKNHQAASFSWHEYTGRKLIPFKSLKLLFHDLWDKQDVFVLLWDMEHVACAMAPYIKEREKWPAVIVMDEEGKYVIPYFAGRMKGVDDWCRQIAQLADSTAVITTFGEKKEKFGADSFAGKNELHIQDIFRIRTVMEELAAGRPVGIYSDYPIDGVLPEGLVKTGRVMNEGHWSEEPVPVCGISVTDDWEAPHFEKECRMFPRNLVLGVTCETGTDGRKLENFVRRILTENHLSIERVNAVFSGRDLAKEPGMMELADRLGVPYFTYTLQQLSSGLGKIEALCERCAFLGSVDGKKLIGVTTEGGMQVAVYEKAVSLEF